MKSKTRIPPTFEIRSDVPIPDGGPICRRTKYPFAEMQVGQSFTVSADAVVSLRGAAAYWKIEHPGWNYVTRKTNGTATIWRTAAILAALLLATPAFAWTNTNTGHNNQIVDGGPGSQANASQRQGQRQSSRSQASTGPVAAAGGSASASGGNYRQGPTVFVPDGSGQAPCGGGLGAGGSAMSAGAGAGGTLWEFGDCKRMRESAALRSLAVETGDGRLQQAALNELCQIDRVREAFGGSCPVLGERMPTIDVDAHRRDYCFTRNAGDRNQHRECDRVRYRR